MKKIISTLAVAAVIIGYTACGEPKNTTGTTDSSGTMQNQTDTSSTQQTTPAVPDSSKQR
jgi:hypothetical protein